MNVSMLSVFIRLGLDPLAALGAVLVDLMLFGGTLATGGVGWVASIPVGFALGIAVVLLQHRGPSRDNLGLAVGKGILIALLTAIPTPLPSVGTAGLGILGTIGLRRLNEKNKP